MIKNNIQNNDICYLVRLKGEDKIQDNLYYKSTIKDQFCGKLVNQSDGNLYFELNGSCALVIIPHNWVEWMAPSKVLWDEKIKNNKNGNVASKILKIKVLKENRIYGKDLKTSVVISEPKDIHVENDEFDITGKDNVVLNKGILHWLDMFSNGVDINIIVEDKNGKINTVTYRN